jgi:hypothetical protein
VDRLWRCYQRAYISDKQLRLAVESPRDRCVNGVTERIHPHEIERHLHSAETIALELAPINAETNGFVIVRYATKETASRVAFRNFLFDHVAQCKSVCFVNESARRQLMAALAAGNVLCSVEFVTNGGPLHAAALLLAVYTRISIAILHDDNAYVLGKCLDTVTIGGRSNELGNTAIKSLAEGVSMNRIAVMSQLRQLNDANHNMDVDAGRRTEGLKLDGATLRFALYLGDCMRVKALARVWGIPSNEDAILPACAQLAL